MLSYDDSWDAASQSLGSRPNLTREVARHIRDELLSGKRKPGEKIDQNAVAEELGVSRLPVREALIRLGAEGLVDNIARRGAYVPYLTEADIQDHYEMYGLLSGLAGRRAAHSIDAALLRRLRQLVDDMGRSTDPREADTLNFQFHREINRAGGSRRLTAVLRALSGSMPSHFFELNSLDWKRQATREHAAILKALRRGDGQAVADATVEHFRHTGEQAVATLKASGYWDSSPEVAAPKHAES